MAAETDEGSLLFVDIKRGFRFLMKRARRHPAGSVALQIHVSAHDVHDVQALLYGADGFLVFQRESPRTKEISTNRRVVKALEQSAQMYQCHPVAAVILRSEGKACDRWAGAEKTMDFSSQHTGAAPMDDLYILKAGENGLVKKT